MTALYKGDSTLLAVISMPKEQHLQYGAPETVTVNMTVLPEDGGVFIDLQLFNVTKTRLGGAHIVHFNAVPGLGTWMMDKLGSWIDPLNVVSNGCQHQHAVRHGVRVRTIF